MKNEIFVYVVCGSREHIDTLNFSLRYLKHFTRNDIIVVTDERRNKSKIMHDNILNFATPQSLSDKEASIFLKTSLPGILPKENTYCYLDCDVIAVSEKAGEVFGHFVPPVTFALDHCPADEFSPWCVRCVCMQRYREDREQHERYMRLMNEYRNSEVKYLERNVPKKENSFKRFMQLKEVMTDYRWKTSAPGRTFLIKWFLLFFKPYPYRFGSFLERHGGFKWNRWQRKVYDTDGTLLYDDADPHPDYREFVEANFSPEESKEILAGGKYKEFLKVRCTHMHEGLKNKFGISLTENKWRHWNGGVFLFNETAKEFFTIWHKFTLEIFNDPYWEKRDQGTLIATAWKLGLQNKNPLPHEFNFIADYNSDRLVFNPGKGFSMDNFSTCIKPNLVHVYHHFGDKNWPVWQWIESLI